MTKKYSDEEVITALMAAPTLTEAADLLGVSRRTIYNRLAEEGFDVKLKAAQEARDKQLAHIRETAGAEALACLVDIVKEEGSFWSTTTTRDRIEAAKVILTYGNPKTQQQGA